MAVFHKMANYSFLSTIGVSSVHIEKLKEKKISLSVGFYEIKFSTQWGQELIGVKVPKSTNDLAKDKVYSSVKKQILSQIEHAIDSIYEGKVGPTGPIEPEPIKKAKEIYEEAKSSLIQEGLSAAPAAPGDVVLLRDASYMYQPVRGTDLQSVYYVIGLSTTAKVAVKVSNKYHYSIRVEGDNISEEVVQALHAIGITAKGKYLSGHYANPENVPIQRSVGALLTSMGVDFVSPIPNMEKVKKLCGVEE